jgi:hypothetical protein
MTKVLSFYFLNLRKFLKSKESEEFKEFKGF